MGILTFGNQNPVVQSQARDGNPAPLRQDWVVRGRDERRLQSFDGQSKTCGLSTASRGDDGWCGCAAQLRQRPQSVARPDLFDRFRRSIMEENRCPRRMAKPVTAGRRNAEDLRSGTVVRHRFLLDRVDVARDDASIDVQPELALVNPANATQANLVLANLAIAGTRRAHDLVRALDRLPELGDLPHRLARRLPDIEDFRFRNHRLSVHWSYRVKTLCGSESSDASEYFRSTHRMHLISHHPRNRECGCIGSSSSRFLGLNPNSIGFSKSSVSL